MKFNASKIVTLELVLIMLTRNFLNYSNITEMTRQLPRHDLTLEQSQESTLYPMYDESHKRES